MLAKKKLLSIELYYELISFVQTFPYVTLMIQDPMAIQVTSTICERLLPKMKTIKTALRNTMSSERLGDLCIVLAEKNFQIDFDSVVEDFPAKHKNRRIILK